jgi:hypothetical protein
MRGHSLTWELGVVAGAGLVLAALGLRWLREATESGRQHERLLRRRSNT